MPRISPLQVAMAIGTAGAMVDVSAYVKGTDWFTLSSGRDDEFRDTAPGTFSFILENQDGRFTPGNTASPLVTQVTEGMQVCLNIGGRLTAGSILSFDLMSDEQNWGRIQITCDDMLGNAARHSLANLATTLVMAASPLYYWPLNDPATAIVATEQSGNNGPILQPSSAGRYTFGAPGVTAAGETQLQFTTVGASRQLTASTTLVNPSNFAYTNVWITPDQTTTGAYLSMFFPSTATTATVAINTAGQWELDITSLSPVIGPQAIAGQPAYISILTTPITVTTFNMTLLVNGVSYGTSGTSSTASSFLAVVSVGLTTFPDTAGFSHLSITPSLVHEELVGTSTEAVRLTLLASTTPEITLATPPAALSSSAIGVSPQNSTVLDDINDVVRTEVGEIYTATTGTLLAPVQQIIVRERDRTTTPLYSFDALTELHNTVQFIRDITNMVSSVTVNGPGNSTTVTDSTITGRAGSASTSETILNTATTDLLNWGQDRLFRGKNVNLKVATFTVDAIHTPTDRSAQLLALKQGDRIRITNLPSATLGFTTWDGHIIGRTETHGVTQHQFAFKVKPALPTTAVYDATDRWQDNGELSLNASITNVATTMQVATSSWKFTTAAGDFPQTVLVDNEQMTATACTSATPQIMTVTRGVNGTTAAAHTSTALVHTVSATALWGF